MLPNAFAARHVEQSAQADGCVDNEAAGCVGGPARYQLVEDRRQLPQLIQVGGSEPGQPGLAVGGQADPGHPAVGRVGAPLHHPGRRRPVH